MRTCMRFSLAALLAMPFTLASVRAIDPELETTEQKVKRLEKELRELRDAVKDLREKLTENAERRNSTSVRVRELQKQLEMLDQIVQRHTELLSTPITRQSAYGPGGQPAGPGGAAAPSVATVTIRNQYPTTPITVRLNGQILTVEPNRTMTVTGVPVGRLTYEVTVERYQLQPTTVTLSPAGREINVYPLQP